MSGNRSVQAAQRRRAGGPEPGFPGKVPPQPSINSSQVFAKSGISAATNAVPGKQFKQGQGQPESQPGGFNKMTIAHAITLITLRLGALETKVSNQSQFGMGGGPLDENVVMVERGMIESLTSRLDDLEKSAASTGGGTSNVSTSAVNKEITLIKQQLESFKQAFVQTKSATTSLTKENKELKAHIETLKKDLVTMKELLDTVNDISMENSQKIFTLSMSLPEPLNQGEEEYDEETEEKEEVDITTHVGTMSLNVDEHEDLDEIEIRDGSVYVNLMS
jgi:chromosome segregation ATPase